jgi:hypothetical protein
MKNFLKRLWQCKYLLIAFAVFLYQNNKIDQIFIAIFIIGFALQITMQDLFEKYLGKQNKN